MKILTVKWFIIMILINGNALGRKVKRKPGYILSVPPPPKLQSHPSSHHGPNVHIGSSSSPLSQSHNSPPYHFEEINHDEFPNPPKSQDISRYESDYGISAASSNRYVIDNGLRSIAKGSADQATSAVASQNAAGKQAAYVAKSTLAQAAAQAAGTAIAVLKGKEVLLRRLEEQSGTSIKEMESELAQLQQAKRSAKAAQYAAQQAINHVSVLTAALNNAQSASELAQRSASEAAAELASQIDMVAQAKAKVEQIESQLYAARLDYEETKEAAEKASYSANEAQINANDAAVHANVELSESVNIPSNEEHYIKRK